ncbi:MAG: hypothetical protein C0467_21995 [Planctomycetaceae bacterium]|nr:hypothetical protein [Planctomycetaceae bacterium]
MFSWLFGRKEPFDPPTEKQVRYAKRIGVKVTDEMSKADVSAAIAAEEKRKPGLARKREKANEAARERKFGKEVLEAEEEWNRLSEEVGYFIAVYMKRKETIVDVLFVNQAEVTEKGELRLLVAAPKVMKDRDLGDWLIWDKEFELPIESLLHFEPLHPEFHHDGNDAYQKAVERGLKIARGG